MKITDILGKRLLFFDGAMGTALQEKGLGAGELPELWNLERPESIQNIHEAYLTAGCDIVKTNTFGANAVKLHGCGQDVSKIVSEGVKIARSAVDNIGHGFVAMDIGPTGKLLQPMGDLSFEDSYAAFKEMAVAGERAGADLILIETMSDLYEAKAALLAAKENTSLPVFITMIFDENGKLLTGGDIPAAVALLESLHADAIGINCGLGPAQMQSFFPALTKYSSLPLIVNPNAGLPQNVNGKTTFTVQPEEFSSRMAELTREGAWVVGGCCGTTPEHLSRTIAKCRDIPLKPLIPKHRTWVSSFAKAVKFGTTPVRIGERINPTGKSRLKQALRDNDIDYILREGVIQQQNGADILDVNVGLPEIDETKMMCRILPELQSVTDLPLQIDTSNPETMEAAMRLYNGKPLINSVNGKKESMEAIFPLMQRYGGTVIALTLDEDGIPSTAEGRFEIARKIIHTAQAYGISKDDIIIDALAMTISADSTAANTVLETLQLIRDKLGVKTSLGVSNISFGLPNRDNINAAFFTMAMQNGLNAAILNPSSPAMTNAYLAFCALSGLDENCQKYINSCIGVSAVSPASLDEVDLQQSVIRGLRESARTAAEKLLDNIPPLEVINRELIPALDFVGREFETGRMYLPQLLMSAETAKAVFELVRAKMTAGGAEVPAKKGKIILATVKGDIHDIGKNIVKVLLENYGYQVIDLGKDVSEKTIVATAVSENVRLVGLSALMTTTVANMEKTIALLREKKPDCRIMVGGAVLNKEYAEMIGADYYSKDAMGSVRYADEVFG